MVNKITAPIDNVGLIEKVNDIIDNTNLGDLSNVTISSPSAGQNLTYDATNQVWKNTSTSATVAWGGITGTLDDQTDLKNALDDKYDASNPNNYTSVVENTVSGWGFTKNTGTVTSVNNVSPVNGNVTLSIPSIDNLANKDLSNLSSTGNAKFQAPLVSGTNIKTINGTSILGSGNITTPTANDGTLTIQLNGTTVETFSANSSSNKTANIQATQVVWRKYTTT